MGYTIMIGTSEGREGVRKVELDEAPLFDYPTGKSNVRLPSYSGWADFMRATGTERLFKDPRTGLMRRHPGKAALRQKHLKVVREALAAYRAQNPGATSASEGEVGYNLSRLEWLEWWMAWALKQPRPTFENS